MEAIELANAYGVANGHPLDRSQEITLETALGTRPDHTWAAATVADFEPRQNGKNDTIAARGLAGLLTYGERLIIHTAHEFATANESAANFDYGPILVNGDGLPLYIYSQDTQNGGTSACTDEECVAEWPPLTTEGTATAGPGAIQILLGTITREDGTIQVTYNGWPLYLYSGDTSFETTNGQGAEPGWTLVSPAGKPIAPQSHNHQYQ